MKKFLIIIMSLVYCACLTPIIWYAILHFTAPEKVSSQTYNVGSQTVTTVDGDIISDYFCEINIYDDVYELKFTSLLDETKTGIYQQGIQFVPNSSGNFDFEGTYKTEFKKIQTSKTTTYSEGIWAWKKPLGIQHGRSRCPHLPPTDSIDGFWKIIPYYTVYPFYLLTK